MRKLNQAEIRNVLSRSGDKRYKYFISFVCDVSEAWGLYHDGWALASSDDGSVLFPLWPAKEYAALCSSGEWKGYKPEKIDIEALEEELIPALKKDGLNLGIFYTPHNKGVPVPTTRFAQDLSTELAKYR